jgi:formate dehydrogenase beta subunit
MTVRVQLPDLEHWKSQVKCQAGCPVKTDAGRYVQLIAEGRDEEAFLVARAPNPFASVCGRVCAAPSTIPKAGTASRATPSSAT